jgi:hypothetical protein
MTPFRDYLQPSLSPLLFLKWHLVATSSVGRVTGAADAGGKNDGRGRMLNSMSWQV